MKNEMLRKGPEARTEKPNQVLVQTSVARNGLVSKDLDKVQPQNTENVQQEVPSIKLNPEQIEEIHADEYSLTLFYATRVEPLTVKQLKREFPEPEPRKAQSVMDRFLNVGLVQVNSEGAYYSNFPTNYINYSNYRYDGDLEAKKDAKVFQLMKEFTGKSEYWKDKSYFSMDAFFSEEQSKELSEMLKSIKLKAKEYANANAKKKSVKGLKFRRLKYYDMTFGILIAVVFGMFSPKTAYAGGGNDPVSILFKSNPAEAVELLYSVKISGGGGNDPTTIARNRFLIAGTSSHRGQAFFGENGGGGHDPGGAKPNSGGGGHDPGSPVKESCRLAGEGYSITVTSSAVCRLKMLIDKISSCSSIESADCVDARMEADLILKELSQLEK